MTTKISIIVPVFNLEKLLPNCINSILSQTFTDFELILVNDGSTDKSGEICDKYAKHDKRIEVIHKSNGGVSSARNAGLEVAKGDYIGFVDSDDYINKYMFEILYSRAIRYSSDMVLCSYKKVYEYENHHVTKNTVEVGREQHFTNLGALKQMYEDKSKYIAYVVPWNKIYKKHLFEGIKYREGNIYDDETVAHKLLYQSNKITVISSKLYFYYQRKGSQMNSTFHIKRFDKIFALHERAFYFKECKEADLFQKALKHYMDMFFWYYYLAKNNLTNIDKELVAVKRTIDKSLLDLLIIKKLGWKQKLMCILFCVNPNLFEFVRDIKIKKGKAQH